ncbi:YhfC family intramembrane metalloprotease [Bacillus sp. FJAT-50079]|uniref:YhfC family intramembrane metalloprotease n=1 Tax=Bacillus sp. FJAT-50079 TaxID=2833577 RepID=UPI001BCA0E8B|nr:YhfC family intramembrane metalloprotease [Bacillus sp. FJAT-50079]MBS4206846.1 YhfC family intramembrane metalloprotease [Bacillus sp. FJAT-50079]
MVTTATMIAIIVSFLIAVGTPIALLIIFKKKFGISLKVLLFGMLTFFLFAQVLEGLAHSFFLVGNETTKQWFENPWLFMLYGGLMAGIFEETGRFLMMKFALKKFRRWKDGLSFGIGHGGIEAILLIGINSVMLFVFALMINNGTFESLIVNEQASVALAPVQEQLTTGSPLLILLSGIERLGAMSLHIGLSILVLYAIKSKRPLYFIYAILIHALFDFPAALYQAGVIKNIFMIEAFIAIVAIGAVVWTVKSKRLFAE